MSPSSSSANPDDKASVDRSLAYRRMKTATPYEFEPKTIFLCTPDLERYSIDWRNCFPVKAAVVYRAVTGNPVNKQTKSAASWLLLRLAQNCVRQLDKTTLGRIIEKMTAEEKKACEDLQVVLEPVATQNPAETKQIKEPSPEAIQNLPQKLKATIDGIYLVVGFLADPWARDDARVSAHSEEAIADIIKIENQLPLTDLQYIVDTIQKAMQTTREYYGLQKDQLLPADILAKSEGLLVASLKDFSNIIRRFCLFYSPFYSKGVPDAKLFDDKQLLSERKHLLDCLHYSLARGNDDMTTTQFRTDQVATSGHVYHTPSARRLARAGLRLRASEDGVIRVQFKESPAPSELTLPALRFDDDRSKLETVVWNLLAWECLRGADQKPVTRYFQLMNELVTDVGDVRLMKKAGVLRGSWEKGREVVDLVKRIDGVATYPSLYMPLDEQMKRVVEFYDGRMKRFLVKNRPAVIWVSSVAAASVAATFIYRHSKKKG